MIKTARSIQTALLLAAGFLAGLPLVASARVKEFTPEQRRYQCHILAVDENGSALEPIVTRSGPPGKRKYTVSHQLMEGEDTRTLAVARDGRKPLHEYLERMFAEITKDPQNLPREVVIYIHGGLNSIDGAIEKTARLTDYFAEEDPGSRTYYIGICWNSDLLPTYDEHLWKVREGLRQPGRALVSAPATILADLGTAVARTPLRMIDLLYNDAHTVNPDGFARHRAAEFRFQLLEKSESTAGPRVSRGDDDRSAAGKMSDAARWVITSPVKAVAVPLVDTLGTQPWKNMVRRTRTMFERETGMLPTLSEEQLNGEAKRTRVTPRKYYDQITASARYGATRIFCHYASQSFAVLESRPLQRRPQITLIGHSMGAIVAAEMLHRSHSYSADPLPFDNVAVLAAACSVNDFKNKMVPYLAVSNEAKGKGKDEPNTRFYNLCLNDNAERAEKNPGEWDLSPRGSLLVWIDTMFQDPESENDRTLGRWENAILATDDIPSIVYERTTIKAFGRNRAATAGPDYTVSKPAGKQKVEPQKHGDFTRHIEGQPGLSFAFWRPIYWEIESKR